MNKLEHPLWIVQAVNAVLGPLVSAALAPLGFHFAPGQVVIPDYLAIALLIVIGITVLCLLVRSRLSVENPSRFQILVEDGVMAMAATLDDWIGPKGRKYVALVSALGLFILCANYIGMIPGFMAPTANINVPVGCALTIWVYYHVEGIREQGIVGYVRHFWAPPGVPWAAGFIMFPIELISHAARILSLSLRLFGNVFAEELVVLILASLIPFVVPLPMMLMGLITGGLQAYIFVLLSVIYLQGAVAVEHETDVHGHDAPTGRHAPASA